MALEDPVESDSPEEVTVPKSVILREERRWKDPVESDSPEELTVPKSVIPEKGGVGNIPSVR